MASEVVISDVRSKKADTPFKEEIKSRKAALQEFYRKILAKTDGNFFTLRMPSGKIPTISKALNENEYGGIATGTFIYVPHGHIHSSPDFHGKIAFCIGVAKTNKACQPQKALWFLMEGMSDLIAWDQRNFPNETLLDNGLVVC